MKPTITCFTPSVSKSGLYRLRSVRKPQSTDNYIQFCYSTFSDQIFYLVIGAVLCIHSGREAPGTCEQGMLTWAMAKTPSIHCKDTKHSLCSVAKMASIGTKKKSDMVVSSPKLSWELKRTSSPDYRVQRNVMYIGLILTVSHHRTVICKGSRNCWRFQTGSPWGKIQLEDVLCYTYFMVCV